MSTVIRCPFLISTSSSLGMRTSSISPSRSYFPTLFRFYHPFFIAGIGMDHIPFISSFVTFCSVVPAILSTKKHFAYQRTKAPIYQTKNNGTNKRNHKTIPVRYIVSLRDSQVTFLSSPIISRILRNLTGFFSAGLFAITYPQTGLLYLAMHSGYPAPRTILI